MKQNKDNFKKLVNQYESSCDYLYNYVFNTFHYFYNSLFFLGSKNHKCKKIISLVRYRFYCKHE